MIEDRGKGGRLEDRRRGRVTEKRDGTNENETMAALKGKVEEEKRLNLVFLPVVGEGRTENTR